ncbi:type II toxin-antitoxin system HicB family antitoxin [Leuconostoc citreum]|uniref:type II toxin-antitoxin system HicB family antitoxin n=1 Tax=Leuconostoc citreum TaxID=33964 RepID=UPI0032DFD0A7
MLIMAKSDILFYPTVLTVDESENNVVNVRVPDVGAVTFGADYQEAMLMALDAVGVMLEDTVDYPKPSNPEDVQLEDWETPQNTQVIMVAYDMAAYRRTLSKTVRRNISIPEYLNNIAKKQNVNVSKVTTDALESILLG